MKLYYICLMCCIHEVKYCVHLMKYFDWCIENPEGHHNGILVVLFINNIDIIMIVILIPARETLYS